MTNFWIAMGVIFTILLVVIGFGLLCAWIESAWGKVKGAQQHKMWERRYRERDAECTVLELELEAFRDKEKGAPYR